MRSLCSVLLMTLPVLLLLPDCTAQPSGQPGVQTGAEAHPPSVALDPVRAHIPSGGR